MKSRGSVRTLDGFIGLTIVISEMKRKRMKTRINLTTLFYFTYDLLLEWALDASALELVEEVEDIPVNDPPH